jgi:hypothetical protein
MNPLLPPARHSGHARFSQDLDSVLAHAATTLALAEQIHRSLQEFVPCAHRNLLWRPNR